MFATSWSLHGPPKEIFFAQEHRPGEAMQTDFTWIWIGMIVYLLLAILKQRYGLAPSLSKLLHFLKVNLFQ